MTTVAEIIQKVDALLQSGGVDNWRSEAVWLLEGVMPQVARMVLPRESQDEMEDTQAETVLEMARRRASGEPLQYILGTVDFYNVTLAVGPGVLIPRPETEELVEYVVEHLPEPKVLCDVCTGSGAIAFAIAKEYPECQVYGIDLSEEALNWAKENRRRLAADNVLLLQGDLFATFPRGVMCDIVTANPPYVSQRDYETLDDVVRLYEPRLALVAENQGLAVFERIVCDARRILRTGGWLVCEIGDEQGVASRDILEKNGYSNCMIRQDLAGQDRIAIGQFVGKSTVDSTRE